MRPIEFREQDNLPVDNIRVWNGLADRFQSTFPIEQLALNHWLGPTDRILDFGCGAGRVIQWLSKQGYNDVIGCDASTRMCEIARLVTGRSIFLVDSRRPELSSGCYDAVIMSGVLSSVVPQASRCSVIRSVASSIRDAGLLIVGDFGRTCDPHYVDRYRDGLEDGTFLTAEGLWIHHFEADELLSLLSDRFEAVHRHTTTVPTTHGRLVPGHVLVARRR